VKLTNIILGPENLVNTEGTSDGTQDKYYKDHFWYKTDRLGQEGEADLAGDFDENAKFCFAKSFSGSFALNYEYLKEYVDLTIDAVQFQEAISKEQGSRRAELLLYRVANFKMHVGVKGE
jgi:hypothetical protein